MLSPLAPRFEDRIGAQVLTAVLTQADVIKERHDSLQVLDHVTIRQDVRLVVGVDRLMSSMMRERWRDEPGEVAGPVVAASWTPRVVVPLAALDRHSRATTHVCDESGAIVPLFTTRELNTFLGGGLVSYAQSALGRPIGGDFEFYLRNLPHKLEDTLDPAEISPALAAAHAFNRAQGEILAFAEGFDVLRDFRFSNALKNITSAIQLVVELDVLKGPTRVLAFGFNRPVGLPQQSGTTEESRPISRTPTIGMLLGLPIIRTFRTFWNRGGVRRLDIELGSLGGAGRYRLDAEAPFDTWFASAEIQNSGTADAKSSLDIGLRYRLTYERTAGLPEGPAVLGVELRSVLAGVARTSLYAAALLTFFCLFGLIHVLVAKDHAFLRSNTDAGASVLLLFPGIAASILASQAPHTLTAQIQFPIRLLLWTLSLVSFVLATATALSLTGWCNVAIWGGGFAWSALSYAALDHRRAVMRGAPSRPSSGTANKGESR